MAAETAQTIVIGQKRYVLISERRLRKLVSTQPLPRGTRSAIAFADHAIGSDLRHRRRRIRLSQAEVARRAGIRVETLSRIENGHGNPTVATVRKILRALAD